MLNDPIAYELLGVFRKNGGLIFAPAGNGIKLKSNLDPALIIVGSTDEHGKLRKGSSYGDAVWLLAPDGSSGKSFSRKATECNTYASASLIAASAAKIWSANPRLTNDEVLERLKQRFHSSRQDSD